MSQYPFRKEELERYSRQILLYGRAGQERLARAHVAVIGAGGLGSAFLPILAASGVGKISIWDGDTVERSNLGRQFLYLENEVGLQKAELAAQRLRALNPHIHVIAHAEHFTAAQAESLRDATLVFEGSDSLNTKFLLNDLALKQGFPLVISAVGNAQGHTMLICGQQTPCYRCLFEPIDENEIPRCATEGILSAFPAFVGAQAAHVAVRKLLEPELSGGLWIFEKSHCRSVSVKKRHGCICSDDAPQ
ncbi:MAG: HesA/MoeB/ThiF family protein [Leptospiraceae bacterium]|nr:HesA/MoeB/ThiF family protein [Leptospiraceae bacterium]